MDSETVTPMKFKPLSWLKDAKIYNKRGSTVPPHWLEENADVIILLFTAKGVDRESIVNKFYTIYESIKVSNVAVEVINIPFDETEEDFQTSYEEQANWFTLRYDDTLVFILKHIYSITCIPFMIVIKPDCTVISKHGLDDLEKYGKNAIITWLTTPTVWQNRRRLSLAANMYGDNWKYASAGGERKPLVRKYSGSPGPAPKKPED